MVPSTDIIMTKSGRNMRAVPGSPDCRSRTNNGSISGTSASPRATGVVGVEFPLEIEYLRRECTDLDGELCPFAAP
eukprot:m.170909 g.170909  ORF g.170909 m.170909 type:complete len:76 (+) comp15342_c0_seq8:108-335(+)